MTSEATRPQGVPEQKKDNSQGSLSPAATWWVWIPVLKRWEISTIYCQAHFEDCGKVLSKDSAYAYCPTCKPHYWVESAEKPTHDPDESVWWKVAVGMPGERFLEKIGKWVKTEWLPNDNPIKRFPEYTYFFGPTPPDENDTRTDGVTEARQELPEGRRFDSGTERTLTQDPMRKEPDVHWIPSINHRLKHQIGCRYSDKPFAFLCGCDDPFIPDWSEDHD